MQFPFSPTISSLSLPDLAFVDGALEVSGAALLTELDLSALDTVGGDVTVRPTRAVVLCLATQSDRFLIRCRPQFRGNALLLDLSLPSFTSGVADEGTLLTVEQNDALLTVRPQPVDFRLARDCD